MVDRIRQAGVRSNRVESSFAFQVLRAFVSADAARRALERAEDDLHKRSAGTPDINRRSFNRGEFGRRKVGA